MYLIIVTKPSPMVARVAAFMFSISDKEYITRGLFRKRGRTTRIEERRRGEETGKMHTISQPILIHTYTHTHYIHTYIHTHTRIHTHIHTPAVRGLSNNEEDQ